MGTKTEFVLPEGQKGVLMNALSTCINMLNKVPNISPDESYRLFDMMQLRGMIRHGKVTISFDEETAEKFTQLVGIDLPDYIEDVKEVEEFTIELDCSDFNDPEFQQWLKEKGIKSRGFSFATYDTEEKYPHMGEFTGTVEQLAEMILEFFNEEITETEPPRILKQYAEMWGIDPEYFMKK